MITSNPRRFQSFASRDHLALFSLYAPPPPPHPPSPRQIFGPGTGELKVVVEGPEDEAPVNIAQTPTDDGVIYDVSYTPTTPGEYKVHVTVDDVHIPGSTFLVIVLEEMSLGGEGA